MDKLDRLGWAAGLAITAYGVRLGIRVNEADVLKRVETYLRVMDLKRKRLDMPWKRWAGASVPSLCPSALWW